MWGSDHHPVLTRIQSRSVRLQRSFKFDRRWLLKVGLKEAIEAGWGVANPDSKRPLHLKSVTLGDLYPNGSEQIHPIQRKKIEMIKDQLERAQEDPNIPSTDILNLKYSLPGSGIVLETKEPSCWAKGWI